MAGLDAALAGVTAYLEKDILIDTVRVRAPATGAPVLNETTGQLERPEGAVVYEGPGAVVPQTGAVEGVSVPNGAQPWVQQTRSRYMLLTPLSAPVPPERAIVEVTAVHDPTRDALLGRTWICADAGYASTVEVVRRTALDQNQAPTVGGSP